MEVTCSETEEEWVEQKKAISLILMYWFWSFHFKLVHNESSSVTGEQIHMSGPLFETRHHIYTQRSYPLIILVIFQAKMLHFC